MFVGKYIVMGRMAETKALYQGKMIIERKEKYLKIIIKINNKTIIGEGEIEH